MTTAQIHNSIAAQRFAEHVRNGWHWAPEVLAALKSSETTPEDQAYAYFSVDETEGLSVEDAADVIRYAMQSPAY